MPTDPPKTPINDSSFDEQGEPSVPVSGEGYCFRYAPEPAITVSKQDGARWQQLSTVLLSAQEVRRFLKMIQPPARNAASPEFYSELKVELRKQGATVKAYQVRVPYGLSADADERDLTYLGIYTGSTISLNQVFNLARDANERGISQVRYASKPRRQTMAYRERRVAENSAWENKHALEALIQVPGYVEVTKRFRVDVARLQEDTQGVALVASLTPKRSSVLDTVEWHCPIRSGDGRQFLKTLEPMARQAEKNQWLLRWKKAEKNREVLVRIRTNTTELVLWEDGRELPITRRHAG